MICGLGLVAVPFIFFFMNVDVAAFSVVALFSFVMGGIIFNYGLGMAFLKDKHEVVSMVVDGDTTVGFPAIHTKGYLVRLSILGFVESVMYFFLSVANIVFACTISKHIIGLIVLAIASLIVSLLLFFVIGMGCREDVKDGKYER